MVQKLSRLVSIVLHPLLMPTYLFSYYALYLSHLLLPVQGAQLTKFLGVLWVSTAVVPAVFTYILSRIGLLSSLELSDHKERVWPMAFTGLFYVGVAWLMYDQLRMNGLAVLTMLGMALAIVITGTITWFYKISAHAIGAAGSWGILMQMAIRYHDTRLMAPLMLASVLMGGVFSARLALGAHNPTQIGLGALLGFFVSLLLLTY